MLEADYKPPPAFSRLVSSSPVLRAAIQKAQLLTQVRAPMLRRNVVQRFPLAVGIWELLRTAYEVP